MSLKAKITLTLLLVSTSFVCSQYGLDCSRNMTYEDLNTSEISSDVYIASEESDFYQIVIGDFYQSSTDEVLLVSKGSKFNAKDRNASMYGYCNTSFPTIWSDDNVDGMVLNYWIVDAERDTYVPGDYDGDGTDELLCINPVNGYSHLVKYGKKMTIVMEL